MSWVEQAACNGEETVLWFPTSMSPNRGSVALEAKAICESCPVRQDCLMHAVTHGEWDGIWGGMLPDDRKAWARKQGIPRHGTVTGCTGDRCRCQRCRDAITEYDEEKRPRKPCGTEAAYKRHRRRGEEPCRACHTAMLVAKRERAAA